MRLLVITYYWPPSGGAGVQRSLKFVKHLPQFGVECTVITVDPEQGAYPVRDESLLREVPASVRVIRTGTSEPFNSYQKLTGRQQIPYGGFANESKTSLQQRFFKFVRGNIFIPDARRGWNRHVLRACAELMDRGEKFDAVLTSSPPHSTQLIGLELQKRYGLRWLADLRDPWTDIYYHAELNQTAPARWLDAWYERQVLEQADEVLVTSPDTKRLLLGKSARLTAAKFHVLPNGYDESDFREPSTPPTDQLLITHTGTITETYHIELFLRACAECAARHPDVPLRLRFVGQVSEGVRRQIAEVGLSERTELLPFVPHDESVGYLLRSTLLLMAIPDVDHNFGILPGKVFEYLAANKPIICIGPVGSDADNLLEECGAGRVLAYGAYAAIVEHLENHIAAWRSNPNLDLPSMNHSRYSRRALTGRLAQLVRPASSAS
ncbi:glycosyltransferase family 4 protein [Hymenobacter sp. BT175]|uniref:glycosyltransferase family 4 protein n=1 Tax=Hymenobacter translucens TaxID=2886507 RepID=UPI001D0EBD87|nr:glycosyltransferase family 4 protein [Hymenobacter translucens]MCC2545229.1 glycosyltransferase family 4 protein [Hymenobacter translucens]